MTGVARGSRVRFLLYIDSTGLVHNDTVHHVGVVLDRTDGAGEWWVSSTTTGGKGAVRVKARMMESAANMHGSR